MILLMIMIYMVIVFTFIMIHLNITISFVARAAGHALVGLFVLCSALWCLNTNFIIENEL